MLGYLWVYGSSNNDIGDSTFGCWLWLASVQARIRKEKEESVAYFAGLIK